MVWMLYKNWNGNVIGRKVRVPAALHLGATAYGPSANALMLRPGAVGTLVSVLPQGARKPLYVRFPGELDFGLAAEVVFRSEDNTPTMWADFRVAHMDGNETQVVILRKVMDLLEIDGPVS